MDYALPLKMGRKAEIPAYLLSQQPYQLVHFFHPLRSRMHQILSSQLLAGRMLFKPSIWIGSKL